jgi:hypothetical protein
MQTAMAAPGAKEKSCILLWMGGGPSHVDTFDPKPAAGMEIRGPFNAIGTNVSGIQISEHLPLLAKQMDKFSIVRSVTSPEGSHERATHYMLTGYRVLPTLEYPGYGSVVAHESSFKNGLPPYIAIPGVIGDAEAGYLGATYNPFSAGDPGGGSYSVRDVNPPNGLTVDRMERRRTFLKAVDQFQRTGRPAEAVASMDTFYTRAYDLITSPEAKKAFNLNAEAATLRDAYGRNSFGQGCLLARRLVEAGVRFVTVSRGGWDTHSNNFNILKDQRLPELDRGYSALLQDLHDHGMLENTLVVWMGEFGRTPVVNKTAGRDHWPKAMSVCMSGGGLKGGQVVGATDDKAEAPKDRPVTPEDIAATIYATLGLDIHKQFHTASGRPVAIAQGEAIRELL